MTVHQSNLVTFSLRVNQRRIFHRCRNRIAEGSELFRASE
jgi:hypothetical protein